MEDWSLVYKISLLLTIFFHPSIQVRKFSWWYMLVWFLLGWVRETFFGNQPDWFLFQVIVELVYIWLAIRIFDSNYIKLVVALIGIYLIRINLHQYLGWHSDSLFYSSFLATQEYIYWNKWGFELMLFALWFNQEIFSCIKSRWTPNNVIMAYTIGWVVFLSGNY